MLVNVKFFKRAFLISILILLPSNLYAYEKDRIVSQLYNLNSLEFTFDQYINGNNEKGSCLLEFPGKLKCNYFDDNKKELIINNKRLAITQKRYDKTYYYPISNSPFLNILYKDKLLEIVRSGNLELSNQIIIGSKSTENMYEFKEVDSKAETLSLDEIKNKLINKKNF